MGSPLDRLEQRVEHVDGDRGGVLALELVLGRLEGRDLHADHLALAGDRLEQVVELVGGQATGRRELSRELLRIDYVEIEMDVDRRAVERVLCEDERLERRAYDRDPAVFQQAALGSVE